MADVPHSRFRGVPRQFIAIIDPQHVNIALKHIIVFPISSVQVRIILKVVVIEDTQA